MARLSDMPEWERDYLLNLECPVFPSTPWTRGGKLEARRISIVSTAGLQRRGDRPFAEDSADFRVIPGDSDGSDYVMSHISVNFDRTGFQEDINVVFPIDRLRELAAREVIGSVADYHYSFMGATDPRQMEKSARHLSGLLKSDAVDTVLLVPV